MCLNPFQNLSKKLHLNDKEIYYHSRVISLIYKFFFLFLMKISIIFGKYILKEKVREKDIRAKFLKSGRELNSESLIEGLIKARDTRRFTDFVI